MDPLKPELYWVQDRCYRRNPSRNDYRNQDEHEESPKIGDVPVAGNPPTRYEEYDEYSCDPDAPDEEEESSKYSLEKIESGFKARAVTIPSSFFPFIIGAKGATKKRVESETSTKIIIPGRNEKGNIVVRGSKRKDILHALRRLDLMCSQARAKRDITHFACFPMNDPSVVAKVNEFKDKVLSEYGGTPGSGLDETLFQEPEKLHLTLTVMTLVDPRERDEVTKLLQSLEPDIKNLVGGKPLRVNLKGLEIMNDDPSDVHVLYAKCILSDDVIQDIADMVADRLGSSGYTRETKGQRVKLHATLINSRFRNDGVDEGQNHNGGQNRNAQKRQSFDARKLLDKYGDYHFGEVEVKDVLIVTRHTQDKNGFYNTLAKLSIYENANST